ncbi:antirestriction protein [Aquimarina algiphila]|uniref:Antirestriction protein n=1 Tax=Aquimarina algiphila TaxID=2047982 RepID=A0A554VJK9_9FLAO|nr:antirestriction protein [Aquimarina algiphila]TSE08049.1 antirestriction protein [Aquimarina algiphila]
MKKQLISFENYEKMINRVQVNTLPETLQKGHWFFMEAKLYYHSEPTIRETIDMYLEHLNAYLSREEPLQDEISVLEIEFIKRFLDMHRTVQTKEQLKAYIFDLHKAISKKQITKNSPVADEINLIQKKLIHLHNDQLFRDPIKIVINRKWLRRLRKIIKTNLSGMLDDQGLGNIDCPVAIESKQTLSLFSPMNIQSPSKNPNTFNLKGDLGVLLGDIELFELAITIEGDQGGGKTRFTYQLADAFADVGYDVAIFSLEIGSKSDLITRMKEEYLQAKNQHQIFITDQLPEGYKTISNAAEDFDVIIIDSWNKTGLPSQDFDRLRKQHPNTIFIVIFQRTTQKTIRGGTAPLFDAGINIEIIKTDDTFRNNYAITTKNRYGITGIKYNIFNKSIIGAAENVSESVIGNSKVGM